LLASIRTVSGALRKFSADQMEMVRRQ